jgi:hypothetical protein
MKSKKQIAEKMSDLAIKCGEQTRSIEQKLDRCPDKQSLTDLLHWENIIFAQSIRNHQGFLWLESQRDYNRTIEIFENEAAKVDSECPNLALFRMRLRLIQAIAASGWELLDESSFLPKTYSKKEKRKAIELATELLNFVQDRTGRSDAEALGRIEKPLTQFIAELSSQTQKEYAGPNYRQEDTATNFVKMLRGFDLKNAAIVTMLESTFLIFDCELGHRTAQNYVKKGLARAQELT